MPRRPAHKLLCVLNASPFHLGKADEREARMAERARDCGVPLLYSHLVGGQDEVVFDGASFAVDATGAIADARADVSTRPWPSREVSADGAVGGEIAPHCRRSKRRPGRRWSPGVRDYLGKNGFPGAIIGLSGGIDSALVLAIAVDALGADACAR